MVQDQQFSFPLDESRNMFTLIGAASLGILALCTNACLRRWSFEVFLRGHQILTATFVYGTLRHLSNENASSKLYLWVALGILGLTTCLQLVILLYRNGLFAGRGAPRALVSFTFKKTKEDKLVVTASQVRVLLPRPVQVEAGQYINLWIPSVGLWAWTQTHPFTVTSWSRHRQDAMELLVQPRRGLSADLTRHASAATETSVSYMALFTGPHGTTEDVSKYENALLIASGFGIAAVIPYLKKMIYGYNTCTSQIRRLHLVWQVESIDMTNAAQGLLNDLLDDDIIDDGYILNVSIYVRNGLAHNKVPFGEHERFCLYQGTPNYESIVSLEASGDQIERLPNIREERGRTLVVVSAGDDIRDHIREILVNHLGKLLEQIGRLNDLQKSDVLMRAQQGGFIRYHILSTEQEIISSTYRTSCINMLNVTVGLDEQGPGAMPLILEEKQSRKLVRDLGSGLEQLGRLNIFQVASVGVLDADEKNAFLDPVAKRIAMVLLYLNYEELCTNHDRYWPALKKKRPSSHVITCTLQAYHDDPRKSKSEKSRRDQISASYVKRGRLWWILAGTLGVGILQFTHVSSKNDSFNEDKINALVTLFLNTHPGTICTFHELEPVVKSLMFGQVTEGLRQAILNDEIGIFGRQRMAHTQAENAAAIARQRTENPWTNVDAKHIAMENMAKFLTNVL
ncbi:hypothetical protein CBS147321_5676 [Aspergillus niger]|nr:hypothetical protein CBS147321_5676 [Aspergillus niger]